MKLLTKELEDRFLEVGSQDEVEDPIVVCKFFNPVGSATWFITEIASYRVEMDGDYLELEVGEWQEVKGRNLDARLVDVILFGFASLFGPPHDELGYVSLRELESVRLAIEPGDRKGHLLDREALEPGEEGAPLRGAQGNRLSR